jgi:predicted DNA-binding ribbon-helix-helix protein
MAEIADDIGVKKRSVTVNGHATSVALEGAFWRELQSIATGRGVSVNQLVTEIDNTRTGTNLSSVIRVFILETLQQIRDLKLH